ncbi:LemA family protein [Kaistella palustris]|uniref:LemA family protein n=1 Tax=Kaistella palustris TaxID=493376 RepID=UPI00040C179E|nr:LemA family protein [Kaistella palustris]
MMILLMILAIFAVVLFYPISIYNRLVKLRTLVHEAWSSIDVMLKKRHDLIHSLVETVKSYAPHETETFDSVNRARAAAMNAHTLQEKEAAEKNLDQAMMNLNAVAEHYPDLKANTNFLQLQAELAALENDIANFRKYYNGTVRENNILVQTFPSNSIANMYKFEKVNFFELDNIAERALPNVRF